jgi:hypothetical protein
MISSSIAKELFKRAIQKSHCKGDRRPIGANMNNALSTSDQHPSQDT